MIDFILTDIIAYSLWESTEVVAMVVFLANTVSIWLPNKSSNRFLQAILTLLNRLSLNILRNANRHYHELHGDSQSDGQSDSQSDSQSGGKSASKSGRDFGPERQ